MVCRHSSEYFLIICVGFVYKVVLIALLLELRFTSKFLARYEYCSALVLWYAAMAPIKCCVVGCTSTNQTHRLFNLPKDDKLRALWLSFLVSVNSELLGLSKDQLVNKRVCQKHFDKYQLDNKGNRLKDGYPCLFSTKEIEHEAPLSGDHFYDHNYSKKEDIEEIDENPIVAQEHPVDHLYSRPATNPPASSFLNTGNNF